MVGGACIKFGDNVNTDLIMPARYLVSIDPAELAEHIFEPLGAEVHARAAAAKVIVAGANFGCGSAREQAASGLAGAGIQAVIAKSFARTFFRNAINTGLPAVTVPAAVDSVEDGAEVFVDAAAGMVTAGKDTFTFDPYPASLLRILEAGGLIPYLATHVLGDRGQ